MAKERERNNTKNTKYEWTNTQQQHQQQQQLNGIKNLHKLTINKISQSTARKSI